MRGKIARYIDKNIDKSKFNNKNVLITGGNSGIGLELAKEMAYLNANVYLLCRNLNKAEGAKKEILDEFPEAQIFLISLDLASFESIKKASEEIKNIDVDYFINNAGVYHLDKSTTVDGIETVLGTNFIGNLLLNDLILPYFSKLNHPAHVCFETSITSRIKKIDYEDFFFDKKYKKMKVYAKSKYCINNVYFNYIDEYQSSNIVFSLSHPGGVYTPLIRKAYSNKLFHFAASIFMKLAFHDADKAALSMLYSLNKDFNNMSGPRGLGEISGYPKSVKFKKNKDYVKCAEFGRKIIDEHNK